jgi:cytochrome c-type biogenesis protein CcmH
LKRVMMALILAATAAATAVGQETQSEGLYIGKGPLPDPALEARAVRLASELQCPVCQGQSIQASPSPLAQQMKDLIRSQVAEGQTNEQVREYFVSKYGEWVLLEPKAAGFNLLVYILPALALLAGGVFVATVVRRWTLAGGGPVIPGDST